ncbi:MAG: hypothetical protein JRJ19_10925, partial [Deltaproteobacteria bacterium]|nr:hypothetical protein [Deltaproteobacteria bacterium]
MKKGLAFLLFAGILFTTNASLGDESRPVVAVLEIQDEDAGLEPGLLVKLTDRLREAIAEGEVFQLVPPGEISRASKSLSTSIMSLGATCVVMSQMRDLETQTIEVSAKEHGPCENAGLRASVDKVAFKIVYWAGRGKVDKELEITSSADTETVVESIAEASPAVEVKKPSSVKKKVPKTVGPVADALLSVGLSSNIREGLHPKHVSDTEYGLRIDGRLFLGSLVDNPIL